LFKVNTRSLINEGRESAEFIHQNEGRDKETMYMTNCEVNSALYQYCSKFNSISSTLEEEKEESKNKGTGRWTKQEQKLFEEALEKYGKDWKRIQEFVGTRTTTQARSHAQKFFLKLKSKNSSKKDKGKAAIFNTSAFNVMAKEEDLELFLSLYLLLWNKRKVMRENKGNLL
jgi:SHAQKYF class myb-like DNA-binding protein